MKKTKAKRALAARARDSGAPIPVKEWLSGRGCGPRCLYAKPVFCLAAVEVALCDFAVHLWLNPSLHRGLVERKEVARRMPSVEAPAAPLSRRPPAGQGKGK